MVLSIQVLLISTGMSKNTCESSRSLSIFWLKKHDYLCGWRSGGIKWTSGWGNESSIGFTVDIDEFAPYIQFKYTQTDCDGKKEDLDYKVELMTTPCYFGGKRYWFICPLIVEGQPCRRRVGVLYLAQKWFGCRKCYDLAYASQHESRSGYWAVFRRILDPSEKLEKQYMEMRVKYWRGQPTKRYRRWLQKQGQTPSPQELLLAERQMRKLLAK